MKLRVEVEKIFRDFHLQIAFETEGEVFALLGASGSGKSMTLKCIAGIEKPDRGLVTLGGRTLFDSAAGVDLPPQQRRVGYLFQDYALFPHVTVAQNVGCGSPERAAEYIGRFRLRGKENLFPAQLSGGERQRTAIARMLAASPELIMLDEPLSALDAHLKFSLEEELVLAIEEKGGQALLVSHDREEIYRLADRIAVLDGGGLSCIQKKRDLFARPATAAAARLAGWENVMPAENGKSLLAFRAEDVRWSAAPPDEKQKLAGLISLGRAPAGKFRVTEGLGGYIIKAEIPGCGRIVCRQKYGAEAPPTASPSTASPPTASPSTASPSTASRPTEALPPPDRDVWLAVAAEKTRSFAAEQA